MPEYALTLHFGAPDEATARKRADDIADLAGAEHGTRNPVVVPVAASELERLRGELADCVSGYRALNATTDSIRASRDAKAEMIRRIRSRHRVHRCKSQCPCEGEGDGRICGYCQMPWPCPDRQDLDRDSADDALDLAKEMHRQRQRAEQAEDLLRIAHDTSNRSAVERARAVQRAEQAEDRLRKATDAYTRLQAQADDAAAARDRWRERGKQAEAERDALKAAIEELRYERRLLGWARMTLDRVAVGDPSRWEQARREAEDIAQRIVDEIGHPATDEPALGPGYRAAIERTREAMQRYLDAGCSTVNLRQVINLLSPTWPDGNFEAALDAPSGADSPQETRNPADSPSGELPGSLPPATAGDGIQGTPAKHIGGRANAEDCPACSGTNPPYPFICPGEPEPAGDPDYATCAECGSEPRRNYPVAHKPTCSRMTIAPHLWPSPKTPGDAETEDQS